MVTADSLGDCCKTAEKVKAFNEFVLATATPSSDQFRSEVSFDLL